MPRFTVVLAVVAVLGLASLKGVPAMAQDATPAATPAGELPGVTFVPLAQGSLEVLTPATADLALVRVRIDAGARLPLDPTNPAASLVYVSSGKLTFRIEAPMTVVRATAPEEPEEIPAGTEFTLKDGDSALVPPAVAGEVRNDSKQEAIAFVTNVTMLAAAGTPTP